MPPFRALALLLLFPFANALAAPGGLDLTFNGTGKRLISGNDGTGSTVATQSDGKILLAGTGPGNSGDEDFTVYRFNTDGTTDTAFGTNGVVKTDFAGLDDNPHCMALTPAGKIIVGGGTGYPSLQIALACYNSDGTLDTTFGTGGKVVTNAGFGMAAYDGAVDLEVLSDGKILAVGRAFGSPNPNFILVRYQADGSLDSSFGTGGKVSTDLNPLSFDLASGLAIQEDGKILVTGTTDRSNGSTGPDSTYPEFALMRYNLDGSLDTAFGSGGKVIIPAADKPAFESSVFVQRSGRIVVTGTVRPTSGSQIALFGFTSNGVLDATFGTAGSTFTPMPYGFSSDTFSFAAALQKDGRIIVGTNESFSGNHDLSVLRYTANGFLDTSFGSDGKVRTAGGTSNDYSSSLALQDDGKILLSGYHTSNGSFTLVRYQNALAPSVVTLPAIDVTGTTATLRSLINAHENAGGGTSSADFEFGTGIAYTQWGTGPPWITGSGDTPVSATITDLTPGTDYYFFAKSTGPAGFSMGAILEFTTLPHSSNANLSGLTLSAGTLSPAFAFGQLAYTATVPYFTTSLTVTPTVANRHAKVTLNGASANAAIDLPIGPLLINIAVTAQDGTVKNYPLTVTRTPPAPGQADLTFNGTGQVSTYIGIGSNGSDTAHDVLVLRNGRIVVVGSTGNFPATRDFSAARYLPDGSLDTSFGQEGKIITPVGANEDIARTVAEQEDGKLLVAGQCQTDQGIDFGLVRYNVNGSLDDTFGTGGKVITSLSALNDYAYDIQIQGDGKILAVGTANWGSEAKAALVRYDSSGVLDPTFGTGGIVLSSFGTSRTDASSAVVLSDGKILIAGGSGGAFLVARYSPNGTLDKTFAASGRALITLENTGGYGYKLAVQPDGKILVAGAATNDGYTQNFALFRLTAAGALDNSFGAGGKVFTTFDYETCKAVDMVLQEDGRIVLSGAAESTPPGTQAFALVTAGYLPDGALDAGFGTAGKLVYPMIEHFSHDSALAVQDDGRILVASSFSGDYLLLRYHGLPYRPEIAVQSPANLPLADGAAWTIPAADVGLAKNISFQLSNVGAVELNNLSLSIDGPNAPFFTIITPPATVVSPGQGTAFVIRYAPGATGVHTATLHVTSNDVDESPFDIILKGTGVNPRALPVKTLPATVITPSSAILHGSVEPRNSDPTVWFDYGTTANYGASLAITPSVVNGDALTQVSATLTGLLPHTKYHYRLRTLGALGEATAAGLTFTTATTPPAAVNDSFAVVPTGTVILDVLGNDSDPDGDALTLVSTTAVPAAKGKLAKSNNNLIFTAAGTFDGVSFQYTVKDNFGGTATATVTLTAATASIDPPIQDLPSAGVTYSVAVTATGLWSVVEKLPWVSVSQSSPDSAQVTVQPNAAKAARSGTITIAGQQHLITQAGVVLPTISEPALVLPAIVSGSYQLVIPTTNPPVTYSATNLPPGLTIDQTSGTIVGKPTKAGDYTILVKAKNAAGPAPTPVEIDIAVAPLPDGVVGVYNGYFSGAPMLGGFLSYRFELTTATTGALSGKLIGAGKTWPFKGALDADPTDPDHPQCTLSIPRPGSTALSLIAAFDATTDTLTGTIATGQVDAWRQVWKPVTKPAAAFKGAHSFYLDPPSDDPDLPQGRGFGSFIVDEKNGALKATGKLADGNTFTTATFLGPQGQVLIHQPLYTNKGVFGGVITVANDNTISGPLSWYKPAPLSNSRDVLYRDGFGPAEYDAVGGLLPVLPPGGILMGLTDVAGNATLAFSSGALSEAEAFDMPVYLRNPTATGLTNKAEFRLPNPNKAAMPTVNTATGAFSGEFTLPGATTAANRKATFHGQIVEDADGIQGHGFFLLSQPPFPPQTAATAPRLSGRVLLRPTNP